MDFRDKYELGNTPDQRTSVFCLPADKEQIETDCMHERPYKSSRGPKRNGKGPQKWRISRGQENGAPGHGFNNRQQRKETTYHAKLIADLKRRGLDLFKQSRNTPCSNVLDIGFWHMLRAAIANRQEEVPTYTGQNTDAVESAIWAIIKDEVSKIPARKIFNMFMQKKANMQAIIRLNGGSIKDEPHTFIRQQWGTHE
jgi:hypothetical protein